MAATPRPWIITTCLDYWIEPANAPDDDGFHGIAQCGSIDWPDFENKQMEWEDNARLIVTAVNSHDAMLAALKLACATAEKDANWDKPPQSVWYYDAKAAVRAAEAAEQPISHHD
jgi:hypothetical protein